MGIIETIVRTINQSLEKTISKLDRIASKRGVTGYKNMKRCVKCKTKLNTEDTYCNKCLRKQPR